MKTALIFAAAIWITIPASGAIVQERRASMRGGGGDTGKCTIEVVVDGVADVEIRGDLARLRTVSGQPAQWRRFECNAVLPGNPGDFRFRGIDGRGRQDLLRDPRSNGGVAVIRIEDPKSGSEGYTFDIEWSGGRSGGGWGGPGPAASRPGGANWNREINFRGRGDGNYRDSRGTNSRLFNCRVSVSNRGLVEVSFETNSALRLTMTGRLTQSGGNRLVADMSGNGISGAMYISLEGDRVREVSMSGAGRERFELRWRD
jgi:hypothetical protein